MAYKYVDISVDTGSSGNTPFKVSFLSPGGQLLGTLFKGLNEKITQDDLDKYNFSGFVVPKAYINYKVISNITIQLISEVSDVTSISWQQIIDAVNNGAILDSCVGQQKTITIGSTSYDVVLIGVNHDDLVSGGKANTTWQLKNLYNTNYQMNSTNTNSGGYASSQMHKTTFLVKFKVMLEMQSNLSLKKQVLVVNHLV